MASWDMEPMLPYITHKFTINVSDSAKIKMEVYSNLSEKIIISLLILGRTR